MSKNSILNFDFLTNNPFRLLGLRIDASKKEVEKAFSKAKTFAKVGKSLPKPYDGIPHDPDLSLDKLTRAKAEIDQPKSRFKASLFCYWEGSAVDKMALEALNEGDEDRAVSLWEKVTSGRNISKSNYSCVRNLSLYTLANAGNDGALSDENLSYSLRLMGAFYTSEFYQLFIERLKGYTGASIGSAESASYFTEELIPFVEKYITSTSTRIKAFISSFDYFSEEIQKTVKHRYTEDKVSELDELIIEAKRECKVNPSQGYEIANQLLAEGNSRLSYLSLLLGTDDLNYQHLCDSLAERLDQCLISYFNYIQEQEQSTKQDDRAEECLSICKKALSICKNSNTKNKLRNSVNFLEEWIEGREDRLKTKKINDAIEFIVTKLDESKSLVTFGQAKILVEVAKPKLDLISNLDGENKDIQKIIDYFAFVAMEICVKYCNMQQVSYSDVYKEALAVMDLIKSLRTSGEFNIHFNKNYNILKENLNLQKASYSNHARNYGNDSSSSSNCYIATMVYGSRDSVEVIKLRKFRDNILCNYSTGRAFINFYYEIAPTIVSLTKNMKWLHSPVKFILDQFIKIIK